MIYSVCTYKAVNTHTHCTHICWRSVLGLVTTKIDPLLLRVDVLSIEIWSVNKYITLHYVPILFDCGRRTTITLGC